MKFLLNILFVLSISVLLISCSSSDVNEETLEPGTFRAETTGGIENEFSGEATFTINNPENLEQEFLFLSLEAGEVPFVPDDFGDLSTGIFPIAPFDSTSNSLSIDNSPFQLLYINPDNFTISNLQNGTIFIEERMPGVIRGTFDLNGRTPLGDDFNVTGTFFAESSE